MQFMVRFTHLFKEHWRGVSTKMYHHFDLHRPLPHKKWPVHNDTDHDHTPILLTLFIFLPVTTVGLLHAAQTCIIIVGWWLLSWNMTNCLLGLIHHINWQQLMSLPTVNYFCCKGTYQLFVCVVRSQYVWCDGANCLSMYSDQRISDVIVSIVFSVWPN